MKKEFSQKEKLIQETAGTCIYCGHPVTLDTMEVDHIVPLATGGTNAWWNKVCSCAVCNDRKADAPLDRLLPPDSMFARRFVHRVHALHRQGRLPVEKRDHLLHVWDGRLPSAGGGEPSPAEGLLPGGLVIVALWV